MKPVKLAILCSILAVAGCGDNQQSDTAANDSATPLQSPQATNDSTGDSTGTTGTTADNSAPATAPGTDPATGAGDTASAPAATGTPTAPDAGATAQSGAPDASAPAADTTAQNTTGSDTTAADAAAMAPAAGGDAGAQADLTVGKTVYEGKCKACHATGAAGAPKLEDKANWAPRIAQGMDTLNQHALQGFKGTVGFMPPKGGFATLSDDEVKAAVAYMVSQAQ